MIGRKPKSKAEPTEPEAVETTETALRRRLSPEQLEDLDETSSFCVRAANKRLYRIVVSPDHRAVIDREGSLREYYPYEVADPFDRALALLMDLQTNSEIERHGCRYITEFPRPTDYKGKL